MTIPDAYHKTLTFGDLSIGDRFISFPRPGDNSGHGGYLGGHFLWTKTSLNLGARERIEHLSEFPAGMKVILIAR